MIEHTQVLRIKKLRGSGIIAIAARHNLEPDARAKPHIDSSKTSQNVVLRGANLAADVAAEAVSMMEQAKVKRRINEVLGLEVIFSLPPFSGITEQDFFNDALAWAEDFFEIPILSAVIHNDEVAPHCHVIMLPLFDGRMIGSGLMGNKQRLKALQADFHAKVGQGYGLKRGEPVKRHSAAARSKAADSVIDALRKALRGIDEPTFWDAMRDTITESTGALMAYFDIEYEKPKQPKKTFAGIMTKKFKPEKPIGNGNSTKPIGIDAEISAPKVQSLSCVGFANSTPLIQPADTSIPDYDEQEYVRMRDEDQPASFWDGELGNYVRPQSKMKPKSAKIEQVRAAMIDLDLNPENFTIELLET